MELMYRINVGGRKVTPFNDTLWRTWLPDDDHFLKTLDGSSADKAYFTSVIREVGPDNVYNTDRVGNVMSWGFPVSTGYKYLIQMHFCAIASKSLGLLYFNVYINQNLAYKDFDVNRVKIDTIS
ncbi:hypothetical protein Bca52824_002170 [Brassica carinata]|uniref:Malectin domain-containing protein n=1 Tax=Brassica carinata TaxID=52824 RepID=A0A8X7WLJ3_BRACI|nr:hypothetical protein Bca52824_002170 [Brassica carinata]